MTRSVRRIRSTAVRRSTYRRLRFRNVWAARLARHSDSIALSGSVAVSLVVAVVAGGLTTTLAWAMLGAL